ncbi:ATPase (modular protein) [Escherichia fergusonii]|nr:ATPase (modular protein) [Escherichia fergusonii]
MSSCATLIRLIEQVAKVNSTLVEEKRTHALERVDLRIGRVKEALAEAHAPSELQNQALRPLQMCRQRIEETSSIPQIISEQLKRKVTRTKLMSC